MPAIRPASHAVVEGLVRFCGIVEDVAVRRRALEADRDQVALHGLLALRVRLLYFINESRQCAAPRAGGANASNDATPAPLSTSLPV